MVYPFSNPMKKDDILDIGTKLNVKRDNEKDNVSIAEYENLFP